MGLLDRFLRGGEVNPVDIETLEATPRYRLALSFDEFKYRRWNRAAKQEHQRAAPDAFMQIEGAGVFPRPPKNAMSHCWESRCIIWLERFE